MDGGITILAGIEFDGKMDVVIDSTLIYEQLSRYATKHPSLNYINIKLTPVSSAN